MLRTFNVPRPSGRCMSLCRRWRHGALESRLPGTPDESSRPTSAVQPPAATDIRVCSNRKATLDIMPTQNGDCAGRPLLAVSERDRESAGMRQLAPTNEHLIRRSTPARAELSLTRSQRSTDRPTVIGGQLFQSSHKLEKRALEASLRIHCALLPGCLHLDYNRCDASRSYPSEQCGRS